MLGTRGGLVRVAAVTAVEAVAYAVVRYFGIGGYRSGAALAVALLLVCGGGAALILTRDVDDSSDRSIWVTAAAVVAITLGVQAASVAPFSTKRLTQSLDGVNLPFFRTVETRTAGHSWCKPTCPVVTRVYSAPPTVAGNALQTALAGLAAEDIIPKRPTSPEAYRSGNAQVRGSRVDVEVRVTRPAARGDKAARLRVEVRVAARRG